MTTSNPTASGSGQADAERASPIAAWGVLLLGLALLALLPAPAAGQDGGRLETPGTRAAGPGIAVMRDRLEVMQEENRQLRRRVRDLQDQLTHLDARVPHVQDQLSTRIDGLEQHIDDRASGVESSLSLYMRVGTFVLILIGVFGFGYLHQILRGTIERAVRNHLRSEEFNRNLAEKMDQAAEETRASILEASKEETRQLTRKLIDEFLTEERNRIEEAVQDEQEALKKLRTEHLDLQSPVPPETGEYLERVASAVHERSLDLLTDDELYYAMLDNDGKANHLEAERYARELLRRHPATADSLSNLAWILEHGGRTEEAEAHYKRALEADPDRQDVARYYAYLLTTTGRYQEARQVLEQALEREPDNPRTLTQYANLLVRRGEIEEARPVLTEALQANPGDKGLLAAMAHLHYRLGELAVALERYREALAVDPEDLNLLAQLVPLELEADDLDAAEGHIDALLEQAPESVEALTLKGRGLLARGRFGEAETTFRQALTNDGDGPALNALLGLALQGQGRRTEAMDVYNRAAKLIGSADELERYLLQPLRRLAEEHDLPGSDELIQWLEQRKQEAVAGRSPDESEASES
ncbi:tetratricopeptide repeat protein [Thiohalorhabdus sp.]|uniref:tetratricopeptide repeat protein n=1 Tax=Thiohalorhabdus sp. TaxID=3094134 RepID=UPI002FC28510